MRISDRVQAMQNSPIRKFNPLADAAKAEGVNNTESMIDETLRHLQLIPDGKTSMLQDVEAGRKTEVDMFAGTMIQFGKKHSIPTPYNCMIKEFIDIIHENQFHKAKGKILSV